MGNVEDVFSNQVCKGAIEAVESTGDDLFIIPVKYLDRCESDKKDLGYITKITIGASR